LNWIGKIPRFKLIALHLIQFIHEAMEVNLVISILSLGFGLGLFHALDADHIMAVSSLASSDEQIRYRRSVKQMMGFCARWAIGHASVLIALAGLFIFAQIELPPEVGQLAERLIGLLLIFLGGWILWNLSQQKLSLKTHKHDDITHIHLTQPGKKHQNHQPVLVGITHGLAGSAPVLALIPALESNSAWLGFFYVIVFSLGVLTTMLVFGLFLGQLQTWLVGWGQRMLQSFRLLMAFGAIAFGGFWLFSPA
jgi:nickel/cobalt exporter